MERLRLSSSSSADPDGLAGHSRRFALGGSRFARQPGVALSLSDRPVSMPGVTAGIFALTGVLVGALATAASAWFFERRKEKGSLLVAARLVREDVVQAGSCLDTLLRRGWFKGLDLEIASWPEHRAQLAASLPKDAWDEIANAMAGVARIQVMITELLKLIGDEFESDEIPADGRDATLQVIEALRDASSRLDRIT